MNNEDINGFMKRLKVDIIYDDVTEDFDEIFKNAKVVEPVKEESDVENINGSTLEESIER